MEVLDDIRSVPTRICNIKSHIVTNSSTSSISIIRNISFKQTDFTFIGSSDLGFTGTIHGSNIDTIVIRTIRCLESRGNGILFRQGVTTLLRRTIIPGETTRIRIGSTVRLDIAIGINRSTNTKFIPSWIMSGIAEGTIYFTRSTNSKLLQIGSTSTTTTSTS